MIFFLQPVHQRHLSCRPSEQLLFNNFYYIGNLIHCPLFCTNWNFFSKNVSCSCNGSLSIPLADVAHPAVCKIPCFFFAGKVFPNNFAFKKCVKQVWLAELGVVTFGQFLHQRTIRRFVKEVSCPHGVVFEFIFQLPLRHSMMNTITNGET